MGKEHSTLEHYKIIHETIQSTAPIANRSTNKGDLPLRILDAGCGLGAGLMWFEQQEPSYDLTGRTISEDQYKWITDDLPEHKFKAALKSYDDLDDETHSFEVIYSIEALIHTPDLKKTLKIWSDHMSNGGIVILIDDYPAIDTSLDDEEVQLFVQSWLANSFVSTLEFGKIAKAVGLELIQDRDLIKEYNIIKENYRNQAPEIKKRKEHQGWLAASLRRRLTVHGKVTYRMLVLKKVDVS